MHSQEAEQFCVLLSSVDTPHDQTSETAFKLMVNYFQSGNNNLYVKRYMGFWIKRLLQTLYTFIIPNTLE